MRRMAIWLVAFLTCAWASCLGQNNGLPQWKVVKEFHVLHQTSTIPPTVLFTPTKDTLYRINAYMSGTTQVSQMTDWIAFIRWTDETGQNTSGGVSVFFNTLNSVFTTDFEIFRPKTGSGVTVEVDASDPPPQDATYDLAVIIEELTH